MSATLRHLLYKYDIGRHFFQHPESSLTQKMKPKTPYPWKMEYGGTNLQKLVEQTK